MKYHVTARILYDLEAKDEKQAKVRFVQCIKKDLRDTNIDDFADIEIEKYFGEI